MKNELLRKHSLTACAVLTLISYLLPLIRVESEFIDGAETSNLFKLISEGGIDLGIILLLVLPIAQIVLSFIPDFDFKKYVRIGVPALTLVTLIMEFSGVNQDLFLAESKKGIGFFVALAACVAGVVFAFLNLREPMVDAGNADGDNNAHLEIPFDRINGEQIGEQFSNLKAKGAALVQNAAGAISNVKDNVVGGNGGAVNRGGKIAETPEKKRIHAEITEIDAQLNALYASIGKKYAEAAAQKQQSSFRPDGELEIVEKTRARRKELENELIEIDRRMINERIAKDRIQAQQQFDAEIDKLDKALSVGVMSREEYDAKRIVLQKRMDHFESIKKLELQAEMGVITPAERDAKINAILQ